MSCKTRDTEGATTVRIPVGSAGRSAYRSLCADVDAETAALLVDAIERNPDNELLQLSALVVNTPMDAEAAAAWLRAHGFMAVGSCRWCGAKVYRGDSPSGRLCKDCGGRGRAG